MYYYKGLQLPDVQNRNLQVWVLLSKFELDFEASWKIEFEFELSSSKGLNSFIYIPSGMKFGTCTIWILLSDFLYFYLLLCKLKFCSECPINFVTENKNWDILVSRNFSRNPWYLELWKLDQEKGKQNSKNSVRWNTKYDNLHILDINW